MTYRSCLEQIAFLENNVRAVSLARFSRVVTSSAYLEAPSFLSKIHLIFNQSIINLFKVGSLLINKKLIDGSSKNYTFLQFVYRYIFDPFLNFYTTSLVAQNNNV